MLEPGERSLLLETLRPPEGFDLDEAIGTTFSLDLLSLLAVPLAFTMFDWEDAEGRPNRDPILILEAVRRHMARITLFAQAGRISAPANRTPLIAYLEESVVEVTAPNPNGVFHPKVWVLRFTGPEGAVRYRLVCLTRNLTEDRSWDLSLVLDGSLKDRDRAIAASRPLGDFVAALPALAVREVPAEARARAERFATELKRVEWEVPEPFEELQLHPIGIDGYTKDPMSDPANEWLVISPFLHKAQVAVWADEDSTLVSRPEELDKIPWSTLKKFREVLVIRPDAATEEEPGEVAIGGPPTTGLHAKCYVLNDGRDTRVFVGSANLTVAALGNHHGSANVAPKNVEFLVQLRGKKSKVGVSTFLDGDGGELSLRSMLTPYTPPDTPVEPDPVAMELEAMVGNVRGDVVRAPWRFIATPDPEGSKDRFSLSLALSAVSLPDGVSLRLWPITLPEQSSALSFDGATGSLDFGMVAPSTLTTFLGVVITARMEGQLLEERFVLNLPLEGSPEGRREAVLRSILDDPDKVIRFLQFLLDEESAVLGGTASNGSDPEKGEGRQGGEFVILESLLRALTRDPGRLDHVATLLKELGEDREAAARLPKGLLDVWPAVWATRQELRR